MCTLFNQKVMDYSSIFPTHSNQLKNVQSTWVAVFKFIVFTMISRGANDCGTCGLVKKKKRFVERFVFTLIKLFQLNVSAR